MNLLKIENTQKNVINLMVKSGKGRDENLKRILFCVA